MSLIKEYFLLTKKYQDEYGENTILLMQVGSFFEVYGLFSRENGIISGSKIVEFGSICDLNIVEKNVCVGESNIMMAGFKDFQLEKYIKKIQEAGYSAVVYVQDQSAKNTTRSLAGVFSPGTYFQNDSQELTNSLCCIWIELVNKNSFIKNNTIIIGVSNIDIYTGKINIFQFKENFVQNPTTYDELERFISIYNPCETIIISNFQNKEELDKVINYASINSTLIHKINNDNSIDEKKLLKIKNCEKQIYQYEILSKFYDKNTINEVLNDFNEYVIATQSLCYLLDFLFQHNRDLTNKLAKPIFDNNSVRLILANHSLKQLNIINDGSVKPNKYSCVVSMLNNCITPMGKRKFYNILLNPVFDEKYLNNEYNITEYYLNNFDNLNPTIKTNLSLIKDISKWERSLFLKKITPYSLYNLYNNINIIKQVFNFVMNDKEVMNYIYGFESSTFLINDLCNELMSFLDNNINLSIAKDCDQIQNFDINFIIYGKFKELDNKNDDCFESLQKLESIKNYFNNILIDKEKKTNSIKCNNEFIKIHETEKNNYSLLSTKRRCKLLEDILPISKNSNNDCVSLNYNNLLNEIKTFDFYISRNLFNFEKQSSSNNSINSEQINKICKNISVCKIQLKDLIGIYYNKILEELQQYQKKLQILINFITLIDLLNNKAEIAKKYNYCKPIITTNNINKSFVNASNLRHCLIEQFQNNHHYITNDILIGDNNIDGILLYGTNAVGKTTLIRALGISVIMAQAGLYVPCSSFYYKPYKNIFTRIIGNDNIFKGLSTFAVEMSELRTILNNTDKDSLILGDELCSGTETSSALSIFVVGLEYLNSKQSSFIFATHLHEIVNYEEIKNMRNIVLKHMEVSFDREKQCLIYDRKLKNGPGNNNYGLEVCRSLNLPNEFLERALELRNKYSPINGSILELKTSVYNSKKIVGLCELCNINLGEETHHLLHQKDANNNDYILFDNNIIHKNHKANLLILCEKCHKNIHKKSKKYKKIKSSDGNELLVELQRK